MDTKRLREILWAFAKDMTYSVDYLKITKKPMHLPITKAEVGDKAIDQAIKEIQELSTPRLTKQPEIKGHVYCFAEIQRLVEALHKISTDIDLSGEAMANIAREAVKSYPSLPNEPRLMEECPECCGLGKGGDSQYFFGIKCKTCLGTGKKPSEGDKNEKEACST